MCPLAFWLPPISLQVYQTVVHRLGPDNPAYTEAVVALADLHKELGQQREAERCVRARKCACWMPYHACKATTLCTSDLHLPACLACIYTAGGCCAVCCLWRG